VAGSTVHVDTNAAHVDAASATGTVRLKVA
jgi:hypothetical protein